MYTLGAPQGNIDVTLRLGSLPVRNCATFGPPPTKVVHDGSNGKKYQAKHAPGAGRLHDALTERVSPTATSFRTKPPLERR